MNFEQYLNQPWLISPEGANSLAALMPRIMEFRSGGEKSQRPDHDVYGVKMPKMQILNGVAVIPVNGPMMFNCHPVFKMFGVVDHQDVSDDIDAAVKEGCRAIVLDMATPGGTVMGTPELAHKIASLQQDGPMVIAHASQMMASAGYFIAAGASLITARPSSIVGSIGVLMQRLDWSEFYRSAGVKVEEFKSGEFKGGHPGLAMTDAQKGFAQSRIDQMAVEFKEFVQTYREVDEDDMQGQWWTGDEAMRLGFVNMVVPGIGSVLKMFE